MLICVYIYGAWELKGEKEITYDFERKKQLKIETAKWEFKLIQQNDTVLNHNRCYCEEFRAASPNPFRDNVAYPIDRYRYQEWVIQIGFEVKFKTYIDKVQKGHGSCHIGAQFLAKINNTLQYDS